MSNNETARVKVETYRGHMIRITHNKHTNGYSWLVSEEVEFKYSAWAYRISLESTIENSSQERASLDAREAIDEHFKNKE